MNNNEAKELEAIQNMFDQIATNNKKEEKEKERENRDKLHEQRREADGDKYNNGRW